jgi:hypothetical protein
MGWTYEELPCWRFLGEGRFPPVSPAIGHVEPDQPDADPELTWKAAPLLVRKILTSYRQSKQPRTTTVDARLLSYPKC